MCWVFHGFVRHFIKFIRWVDFEFEFVCHCFWFERRALANFSCLFFPNLQHIDTLSYLLLQSIMTTIAIILILIIFCYFGHMVTSDCSNMADSIYNASWYLYPIVLQKSTLFIMGQAQQPFYFTAFKMYKCTLQSFSAVCIVYILAR